MRLLLFGTGRGFMANRPQVAATIDGATHMIITRSFDVTIGRLSGVVTGAGNAVQNLACTFTSH